MDFRYQEFDAAAASLDELLKKLERLFQHLLLQTNGDVDEALRWMGIIDEQHGIFAGRITLEEFGQHLKDQGAIRADAAGAVLELTRKGEQAIRQGALDAIFGALGPGTGGEHRVPVAGVGLERLPETRPYQFGDSLSALDTGGTLKNALRRGGLGELSIAEEDLEVFETEHLSSCATVLLVDISHSMILYGEDRITPAKQVALALTELIRTRYPKDSLHVVTFGDEAEEVPLDSLPYLSVGPFHTNTRAGLRLAQDILRKKKHANRQIFMVTDGKPSALTERGGRIYKNPFGLDRRVVGKTLDEAVACQRYGIPITTFMLTSDPTLVSFVEEFTAANHGRAYYSRPDKLGSFLFVDYISNRRRTVR